MNPSSIYGAFNARWLSPEDVARAFVPTAHFKSLVKFQHSLLMGPRGCGKTTLLKMLTRPAQNIWWRERVPMNPELGEFPSPDFESIYVPSDVRWSYELKSVVSELGSSDVLAELVQRASVGISSLMEASRSFQRILDDAGHNPEPLLKALITHFELGPTVPSFSEVRLKLLAWAEDIHSLVASGDVVRLRNRIEKLPKSITGYAANALIRACAVFEEYSDKVSPKKWALCFDELEIAPRWLQTELLQSLRSVDQHFLLKLTWSPILPSDITEHQERQHDYAAIRMWHAHASDARPFAQQLSTRLIRDRLEDETVLPSQVLGASPFAQDELVDDDRYGIGTSAYESMLSLASKDPGFREYLSEHGINPENPVTDLQLRDETVRKIKPIVLLRDAYLAQGFVRRSRKVPPVYYGEDAIYAMSEGNPRLLAGLLNEVIDAEVRPTQGVFRIRPEVQARVLFAASQRMRSGIRTYPVEPDTQSIALSRLVDTLGEFLYGELVGVSFKPDPVGSFLVDRDVPSEYLEALRVGLLIGAFVYVGSPSSDLPVSVVGARIRLSYMLAPSYRLLFRNFRELRMSTALRVSASSQRSIFWSEQG